MNKEHPASDELYKGIPHKHFDGDVTKSSRLSPDKVMDIVDLWMKNKLCELKQKYIRESMETIFQGSKKYPKCFEELGDDAPAVLYALGNVKLLRQGRKIAVIGSRDVSEEGYENAYQYAKLQAMQGCVIVSGLALGCDTAAHKGALDAGGLTIAIVGSGLDCCHPIENKKLMNEIIKKGGLVLTEYELGLPATPYRLTTRCRLQAALADEVYVAECRVKSGTMRTIKYAQQLGKSVRIIHLIEDSQEDYYDRSKWIPLEEARRMVIESITREYDRIHACDNENKDD